MVKITSKKQFSIIEGQFSIIEGKYYQAFRNWFEHSCFIGYGIESALYHAYITGRLDQQVIDGSSQILDKKNKFTEVMNKNGNKDK